MALLLALAVAWAARSSRLPRVVAWLTGREELPPVEAEGAGGIEAAIDRLSQPDPRSRVEAEARIERGGAASVPLLINRLALGGAPRRVRDLLVLLAFVDLGEDAEAWARWWDARKEVDREEWALAALRSSDASTARRGLDFMARAKEDDPRVLHATLALLRGADASLRVDAYAFLVGLADRDFGYDPSRAAEEQPQAMAAVERWVREACRPREELLPRGRGAWSEER